MTPDTSRACWREIAAISRWRALRELPNVPAHLQPMLEEHIRHLELVLSIKPATTARARQRA